MSEETRLLFILTSKTLVGKLGAPVARHMLIHGTVIYLFDMEGSAWKVYETEGRPRIADLEQMFIGGQRGDESVRDSVERATVVIVTLSSEEGSGLEPTIVRAAYDCKKPVYGLELDPEVRTAAHWRTGGILNCFTCLLSPYPVEAGQTFQVWPVDVQDQIFQSAGKILDDLGSFRKGRGRR